MHYLLLEPLVLKRMLNVSNSGTINDCYVCLSHFKSVYENLTISKDLSDAGSEKLKRALGISQSLKLRKAIIDIRNQKYKPKEGEPSLGELNKMLEEDVEVVMYLKLPTHNVPESIKQERCETLDDGFTNVRLTDFQTSLINLVIDRFSSRGSFVNGMNNFLTVIDNINIRCKRPELWGNSIERILKYDNKSKLIHMIGENYSGNLENKLNELSIFMNQYFHQTNNNFDTLMKELFEELGVTRDHYDSEVCRIVVEKYLKDYCRSINYQKINSWLGTHISEYNMFLEITELEDLGVYGFWTDGKYLIKDIINNLHITKLDISSVNEIKENPNIKFIVNVLKPLISGEIEYVNQ